MRDSELMAVCPIPETVRSGGVVAAISGGVDSTALAYLLRLSAIRPLHLAWVCHGFHDRAWIQRERRVLQRLAESLAGTFHELEAPRPARWKRGKPIPEAQARQSRYALLTGLARRLGVRVLATGHHLEDQEETRLLSLLRGGALRGLAGMASSRDLSQDVCLWRPFLQLSKRQLQEVVLRVCLPTIEDPTNRDVRVRRNWLRHRLLPELRRKSDAWLQRQARLGSLASRALSRIGDQCLAILHQHTRVSIREDTLLLRQACLAPLSESLLHHFLEVAAQHLGSEQVQGPSFRDSRQTCGWLKASAARGQRDFGPLVLWRSGSWLGLAPRPARACPAWSLKPASLRQTIAGARWSVAVKPRPEGSLALPFPEGADCRIRPRQPGDQVWRRGGHRRLKQLFQDHGVPAWERPLWPLVTQAQRILAVPGLTPADAGLAERYLCFYELCSPAERPLLHGNEVADAVTAEE